ncbi:hypothetical protein QU845_25295, partial [Escherichia coli]|nr:hypothetical protein [Escherichia coli]
MSVKIVIKPNTYFDSVSLMSISTRANKLDGVEHHQAADFLAQVAPAGANQLRNAAAKFMNADAQLLTAGAG